MMYFSVLNFVHTKILAVPKLLLETVAFANISKYVKIIKGVLSSFNNRLEGRKIFLAAKSPCSFAHSSILG